MSNAQKDEQIEAIQNHLFIMSIRMKQLIDKVQLSQSTKNENIELFIMTEFANKLLSLKSDINLSKRIVKKY